MVALSPARGSGGVRQPHVRLSSPFQEHTAHPRMGEGLRKGSSKIACPKPSLGRLLRLPDHPFKAAEI